MKVSVIAPIYGVEQFIERCVRSLMEQTLGEVEFIKEAFERNWVAPLGFNCDGFETEIASYLNEDNTHTLALSSGTAALHLAVKLAGIERGDVVLCSDMTFIASANPVSYEGAVQVFFAVVDEDVLAGAVLVHHRQEPDPFCDVFGFGPAPERSHVHNAIPEYWVVHHGLVEACLDATRGDTVACGTEFCNAAAHVLHVGQ